MSQSQIDTLSACLRAVFPFLSERDGGEAQLTHVTGRDAVDARGLHLPQSSEDVDRGWDVLQTEEP